MLRSFAVFKGAAIHATDGEIGSIADVYFDDRDWTLRYLVVIAGNWLTGRNVLVSPRAVRRYDPVAKSLFVDLTRERIERSPSIDTHKPVSRQQEIDFAAYYDYPQYWAAAAMTPEMGVAVPTSTPDDARRAVEPHLRSGVDTLGYYVIASDGDIGHVEDFLFDDASWVIRYVAVDTRNWWPGKKVVVAPHWFDRLDWEAKKAHTALSRAEVKASPEYDAARPLERDYEEALHRHYRRPTYWNTRDEPVTPLSDR
jgi:hypothetical protein